MAAMLDKDADHDFRIPVRRKTDKPGVVLGILAAAVRFLANHLCGSCLAGNVKPLDRGTRTRSTFVDDAPHRARNDIHGGLMDWILFGPNFGSLETHALECVPLYKMRLHNTAA